MMTGVAFHLAHMRPSSLWWCAPSLTIPRSPSNWNATHSFVKRRRMRLSLQPLCINACWRTWETVRISGRANRAIRMVSVASALRAARWPIVGTVAVSQSIIGRAMYRRPHRGQRVWSEPQPARWAATVITLSRMPHSTHLAINVRRKVIKPKEPLPFPMNYQLNVKITNLQIVRIQWEWAFTDLHFCFAASELYNMSAACRVQERKTNRTGAPTYTATDQVGGDILTRVAIPRSGSFLNTSGLARYKSRATRRPTGKCGGGGG